MQWTVYDTCKLKFWPDCSFDRKRKYCQIITINYNDRHRFSQTTSIQPQTSTGLRQWGTAFPDNFRLPPLHHCRQQCNDKLLSLKEQHNLLDYFTLQVLISYNLTKLSFSPLTLKEIELNSVETDWIRENALDLARYDLTSDNYASCL